MYLYILSIIIQINGVFIYLEQMNKLEKENQVQWDSWKIRVIKSVYYQGLIFVIILLYQ